MIEYLVLLLSTDWFLPHWTEIGIDIPQSKKTCIQQGCREIINQITDTDDSTFVVSFSEYLREEAQSKFLALLRRWGAEAELSATRREWAGLSHRELTAEKSVPALSAVIRGSELTRAAWVTDKLPAM